MSACQKLPMWNVSSGHLPQRVFVGNAAALLGGEWVKAAGLLAVAIRPLRKPVNVSCSANGAEGGPPVGKVVADGLTTLVNVGPGERELTPAFEAGSSPQAVITTVAVAKAISWRDPNI